MNGSVDGINAHISDVWVTIKDSVRWIDFQDGKIFIYDLSTDKAFELKAGFASLVWRTFAYTASLSEAAQGINEDLHLPSDDVHRTIEDLRRCLDVFCRLGLIDLQEMEDQ